MSSEESKKFQGEAWRRWVQYIEPGDEQELATSPTKKSGGRGGPGNGNGAAGDQEEELELEPLPEGTLTRNLGLDLIVVVTKTDYMTELEKDYDYKDEHFDFIQQAVSIPFLIYFTLLT